MLLNTDIAPREIALLISIIIHVTLCHNVPNSLSHVAHRKYKL